MEEFFVSVATVAVAEIGDKTQLLAMLLAARFRVAMPIVFGIAAATVLNHGLAAVVGVTAGNLVSETAIRWFLAVSFAAMGLWCLIPDRLDEPPKLLQRTGAFAATFVSFFLIEMGDKTQLATVALAAHYKSVLAVMAGTTLGMLIADVPVVYVGNIAAQKIPLQLARSVAALIFFVLTAVVLIF